MRRTYRGSRRSAGRAVPRRPAGRSRECRQSTHRPPRSPRIDPAGSPAPEPFGAYSRYRRPRCEPASRRTRRATTFPSSGLRSPVSRKTCSWIKSAPGGALRLDSIALATRIAQVSTSLPGRPESSTGLVPVPNLFGRTIVFAIPSDYASVEVHFLQEIQCPYDVPMTDSYFICRLRKRLDLLHASEDQESSGAGHLRRAHESL